ncbi:MAG: hypothetical protein A2W98_09970 [Bacteroidetes bacterium GWF2_33_38]|nr:MAG: hypothetical protein A2W98_09970 [Bacteroidetes bacterium GWF2_33_38]OFY75211.1 MAG: hypothetical protein A2265_11225 [Bacteroidetes bacterium RIFOXYA12_FULL_33_9]OFY91608.1 MAG: hypothetical protein A2236_11445 [Bacteroidetes bacterium RIFOXYA2_FULL_33_7]HBX52588.1 hypothetical protein [Bacteroidales bacterium]
MKKNIIRISFLLLASTFILWGCGNDNNNQKDVEDVLEVEVDTASTTVFKFNNTLFSVPSPYQIALMIRELNIDYNKDLLNPSTNSGKYTDNFQKALNFGIYGADLGYLNIYEQTPDAINYFSVLKMMSQELGISGAFDKPTINRIEANMGNKDSLLFIMSNTYRKADSYLKDNSRNDVGVLILAGGWIESLHILTNIAQSEEANSSVINRLGEQKHPLDNLIKILSPYYNQSDQFTELLDGLIDLAYEFDGVDYVYKYVEPTTKPDQKLTIVNSESNIIISDEQLKVIADKVNSIRKNIIE